MSSQNIWLECLVNFFSTHDLPCKEFFCPISVYIHGNHQNIIFFGNFLNLIFEMANILYAMVKLYMNCHFYSSIKYAINGFL